MEETNLHLHPAHRNTAYGEREDSFCVNQSNERDNEREGFRKVAGVQRGEGREKEVSYETGEPPTRRDKSISSDRFMGKLARESWITPEKPGWPDVASVPC